jgi:DNA modification methylase
MRALYDGPIASTRGGALFNAHSYPTKINVSAVVACILAHTDPGDLVFDGFSGSGVVGMAAALCGSLTIDDQEQVVRSLGKASLGERDCVLYDLSPLAVFITETMLNPPPAELFRESVEALLEDAQSRLGWMYSAADPSGETGAIRHTVWTEEVVCPRCAATASFWSLAVTLRPVGIASEVTCTSCQHRFRAADAPRSRETSWDDVLSQTIMMRKRTPAWLYGRSGTATWRRPISQDDLELIDRVSRTPIPKCVPIVRMGTVDDHWGELHRSGYHSGMTHVHHFYSRRNLISIASLWEAIGQFPTEVQSALRLLVSSYNASHSTLMTRVVAKKDASDLVVTSAQPAALYVSGLPVEKNVFSGVRRKARTLENAFGLMRGRTNKVTVRSASSLSVDLPAESVDYIFTDPPFGQNIQYAEVNLISEAWLGQFTDRTEEVIVSNHQGKSLSEYEDLLAAAFTEAHRILKAGRFMTVAFHSADRAVWEALRRAWTRAGFRLERTSVLDKSQTSFKQTTTPGAVSKDPLILLRKSDAPKLEDASEGVPPDPWQVVAARLREVASMQLPRDFATRQHLYGFVVTHFLRLGLPVPFDADDFYRGLEERFSQEHGVYQVPAVETSKK